jgi:hypothetical protein
MPVNMIGYKVVYGSNAYKCLQVEPLWGPNEIKPGELDKPDLLRVAIIDHDGYFAVIEDHANQFAFLKDVNGK